MGSDDYKGKDSEFTSKPEGEIIFNYEDFPKAKKGNFLALSMKGNHKENKLSDNFPNCTTTFFVKSEPYEGDFQKVSLKHHGRTSSRLYGGKKPMVVEYILPRTGKLELKTFEDGEVKPNTNNSKSSENNYSKRNL